MNKELRIKNKGKEQGFIALISAIIISVLLLTIALAVSMNGISNRLNILDSESKERSTFLAEACADSAILEIANAIYSTNKVVTVGPAVQDVCTIVSTENDQPVTGQKRIKTQAIVNKAYTNLIVVIDSNFTILSWEESSHF